MLNIQCLFEYSFQSEHSTAYSRNTRNNAEYCIKRETMYLIPKYTQNTSYYDHCRDEGYEVVGSSLISI